MPSRGRWGLSVQRGGRRHPSKERPAWVYRHPSLSAWTQPTFDLRSAMNQLPTSLHIGYVGRLETHKGVDVLLRAIALAENVTAEIVGDGSAAGQLKQLALLDWTDDRVAFIGFVPPSDLPEFYRRFDAVVVPSLPVPGWDEQFCRVAVEAMVSGVPVIASSRERCLRLSAAAELLVPPCDPQALAQAIQTLSSQSGVWAGLRSASLRSVDRFFWSTIARDQKSLYQRAMR